MTQVERFALMGTRCELHLFGAGADDALHAARRAIEAVDDALTIHRPSAATALNESLMEGRAATIDDPLLLAALVEVDLVWRETLGLFDVAADPRIGGSWASVDLDRKNARIAVSQPLALDFGGFGKGFALDRACALLREAGVTSALLTLGESSIAVIGEHPLGGGWPFAVPHPLFPDTELLTLELQDEALSISATVGGGAHAPERVSMIRPSDGALVAAPRCTVAVASSGARAEAVSTALLVADPDRAARLLQQDRCYRFDFTDVSAGAAEPARMCA